MEHWYYVAELVLAFLAIITAVTSAGLFMYRALSGKFKGLHESIEASDVRTRDGMQLSDQRTTAKIDGLRDHIDESIEDLKASVQIVADHGHETANRLERLTGRFEEHLRATDRSRP